MKIKTILLFPLKIITWPILWPIKKLRGKRNKVTEYERLFNEGKVLIPTKLNDYEDFKGFWDKAATNPKLKKELEVVYLNGK